MERSDHFRAHVRRLWSPFHTAHCIRESITATLLGVRVRLQSPERPTQEEMTYLYGRCEEAREQVRELLFKKDRAHAKLCLRLIRSYERKIEAACRMIPCPKAPSSEPCESEATP